MPQKLEECVRKLTSKGYSEEQAWKICRSSIGVEDKKEKQKFDSSKKSSLCERLNNEN